LNAAADEHPTGAQQESGRIQRAEDPHEFF